MEHANITKISMEERKTTFKEVSNGFSLEEAIKEAKRCLQCKTGPCQKGCPANVDIKEFIEKITEEDFAAASDIIRADNSLPAVCGRVCPQEEQCQLACVLNKSGKPIQIGYLERFVADKALEKPINYPLNSINSTAPKVAVVGTGPAGLTCAADLARMGYSVSLFEALHKTGGVLSYGIPEFRLPKVIVEKETEYIKSLGVKVYTDVVMGRTLTIDDLRHEGFKAFFIGVGAGLPRFMNVPGENLNGVYSANEFLTRVNLMKAYDFPHHHTPVEVTKKVVVFGAGNVSFDCARSALRLGAEVTIAYRRTRTEMPAREEEIENAEEEGINFELLVAPKEIISDENGRIKAVRCVRNELGEPDASGRRRPVEIPDSDFIIEADMAVVAIGTIANPLFLSTVAGLKLNNRGYIDVNDSFQTSIPDVFAGGDIVSGAATVIKAINQGKTAAKSIDVFLQKNS